MKIISNSKNLPQYNMSIIPISKVKKNQIIYIPKNDKNINLSYHYITQDTYYKIHYVSHPTKPGKGGAYITINAKSILSGNNISKRMSTDQSVQIVQVYTKEVLFGYNNNKQAIFVDFTGVEYFYPLNLITKNIEPGVSAQLLLTEDNHILGLNQ